MSLEQNILAVYGNRGKAWLEQLPAQITELTNLWELSKLKPMDNLTYNYVLSGYRNSIPIILKLNPDAHNIRKEAQALKAFSGYGTIALLESEKNALLLQRALPGHSLKNQPQAIEIACRVIEKLHQAPPQKHAPFPHIEEWLSDLDQEWDIPEKYLQRARELKDQLLQKKMHRVLLHGDLHQDNILSHGDEWLAIDPKGVIGSPIHEVWACVENPDSDLSFIANYFNYPLEEVTSWYFVHLVLAACWQVEDGLDPSRFISLIQAQNDNR